jgi:hypothetical protein
MSNNAPFPIQPELTAIAIGFRNARMIADEVLPRLTVGTQEFKWLKHTLGETFTVPDTRVGRTGAPNRVSFTATEETASTADFALDDPIPLADMSNRPPNFDPEGNSTLKLTNLIMLDREIRAASAVFNAANYSATNKVTLAGTSQWSDYTNSNPVSAILNAFDSMIVRPNRIVMGRAVFTVLRQHPKVLEAVKSTQQLADLFEVERVLVGEAMLNNARKGQTVSMARAWGKHFVGFYQDSLASAPDDGVLSFGFTAQWGERVANRIFDPNIGMRGGNIIRVGESVKEVIAAPDAGYLFENAIA